MKKLTKLLSAMLVVMMVVSSVASAVTITPGGGAVTYGTKPTMITNFIGANRASASGDVITETDDNTVSGKIGYATDGLITFTFDEDMDVDTLIPANIKVFSHVPTDDTVGAGISVKGLPDDRWSTTDNGSIIYEPHRTSAREYVLWLGDFPGRIFRVIFSANVKTAAGTAITEQTFVFRGGKTAKMPYVEGKRIVQIGFDKPVYDKNGAAVTATGGKMVTGTPGDYSQYWTGLSIPAGDWWKIDLGNIYEVADLSTYDYYNVRSTMAMDIYYSSDPNAGFNADQVAPTLWGALKQANRPSSHTTGADNSTGVNGDRWLNPDSVVTARYIFIKNEGTSGATINGLDIFGYVDNYYTTLTAEKDGETVTECSGDGTYTIKAPVLDVIGDDDASGYMIVAGYDASGVITTIKCEPVSYDAGYLKLDATMDNGTVSIKAALIESFANPYLLTDALILPAAAQ